MITAKRIAVLHSMLLPLSQCAAAPAPAAARTRASVIVSPLPGTIAALPSRPFTRASG